MIVYLITLDSHDYYGPFINANDAHAWAKYHGHSTYQIVRELPEYAKRQLITAKMP